MTDGRRPRTIDLSRVVLLCSIGVGLSMAQPVLAAAVLDDFEQLTGWSATASEGARLEIAHDTGRSGMALRLDFDFGAVGGFVIARKAFELSLPSNYAFSFQLRAEAPPNNVEFKLIDRTSRNVWWYKRTDANLPTDWQPVVIRKRRLEFAWGPSRGGDPKQIGFIELAITSATGGKGSVWIDDLRLDEHAPVSRPDRKPSVRASTSVPGHEPERMLDRDAQTAWRSGALAPDQWLLFDLLERRENGGLVIDWNPEDYATSYEILISDDGETWTPTYFNLAGNGGRDYVYMPDAESRYVRLDLHASSRGQGYAIHNVTIKPFEFSASPNQFFETLAADAPPGTYPKYFARQQTYWTVIGVEADDKEALLNEEGQLEVDQGAFSIEPFLYGNGKLITWRDVRTTQELERGYLPIPSVAWAHDRMALRVTAFAAGRAGASTLYARYRVENRASTPEDIVLFLAVRPFQVLPPWQNLNMIGGVTNIHVLDFDANTVWVNSSKAIRSLTPANGFGAATIEEADVTEFLIQGKVPPRAQVADRLGYASGALEYRFSLEPGQASEVFLAVPFHEPENAVGTSTDPGTVAAHVDAALSETIRHWETLLGRVAFELPVDAAAIVQTAKTTLAYILINSDGPAIQPGSRTYARSWIRDGSMTAGALLDMGFRDEARDFIRWYARYQFPNGKIPCCIDRRGVDHVPEHDSPGQFIYVIAEYYRYTRDIGLVHDLWPAVVRTVEFIDGLRRQRMTPAYENEERRAYYGLLPESISHEGYSAHPVHSYWDDFFALRGLKDAAWLAVAVGDEEHASSFAILRDAFRQDLLDSITRTMAQHKIDFVPASVELGDFDPSSTAIAVAPGGEGERLPRGPLNRTFDKYLDVVRRRGRGENEWEAYTPYELRNVGALVRLPQRAQAFDLLRGFFPDRRPLGWNQWPEILWYDAAAPKFIGDMPHTWIGSTFLRALRSLFAYERESDGALVIAAGLPRALARDGAALAAKRLPTYYGVLNLRLRDEGADRLRVQLTGDLSMPPGHIAITPVSAEPITGVTVNGQPVQTFTAEAATVSVFPADVVLDYAAAASVPANEGVNAP